MAEEAEPAGRSRRGRSSRTCPAMRPIRSANSRLMVIQPRSKPVTWPSSFVMGLNTARRGPMKRNNVAQPRRALNWGEELVGHQRHLSKVPAEKSGAQQRDRLYRGCYTVLCLPAAGPLVGPAVALGETRAGTAAESLRARRSDVELTRGSILASAHASKP